MTQFVFFLNDHNGNGPANAKTFMGLVLQHAQSIGGSKTLVPGWTKALQVKKGGRGSLENYFGKPSAKSLPVQPAGQASVAAANDATTKRAAGDTESHSSPKRAKGPMDTFLRN